MSENNQKTKILESALHLIENFGIRKLTMDDIAKQLAVSKKTIYKFFITKDFLLESILEWKFNSINATLEEAVNSELPYIQKLERIFDIMQKELSSHKIEFIKELKFLNPALWEKIEQFKKANIFKHFTVLIKDGQKQNIIRNDLPAEILVTMYHSIVQNMIHPDYLSQVSYHHIEVYKIIIKVFFKGIMTDESYKQLSQGVIS